MPQLAPEPWFLIFFTTWLSLTFLTPTKILSHTYLNKPSPKSPEIFSTLWTWPW